MVFLCKLEALVLIILIGIPFYMYGIITPAIIIISRCFPISEIFIKLFIYSQNVSFACFGIMGWSLTSTTHLLLYSRSGNDSARSGGKLEYGWIIVIYYRSLSVFVMVSLKFASFFSEFWSSNCFLDRKSNYLTKRSRTSLIKHASKNLTLSLFGQEMNPPITSFYSFL